MEFYQGHLFDSKPPKVRIGNYRAPQFQIKQKSTRGGDTESSDDSFVFQQKLVKVPDPRGEHIIGVIPYNMGRTQKFKSISRELHILQKVPKPDPPQHPKITSENPILQKSNSVQKINQKQGQLTQRSNLSRNQSAFYFPQSPRNNLTSRPDTAKTTQARIRPLTAQTFNIRDRPSTARTQGVLKSQYQVKPKNITSKLVYQPTLSKMILETKDKQPLSWQLQSIKVEEKIYDEVPYRLKIKSYKGEYRTGLREGRGKIYYENGDWYDGDWMANLKHGQGVYYYHSLQAKYTGQWNNGLKQGSGMMLLRSGSQIQGTWNNDRLLYTQVVITYVDGEEYSGAIKDGKRHGFGIMKYKNGCIYEGYWEEDTRHGQGLLFFNERSFYEGMFTNDYTAQKGVLVFRNILPLPPKKQQIEQDPTPSPEPASKSRAGVYRRRKQPRPKKVIDLEQMEIEAAQRAKDILFGRHHSFSYFQGYEIAQNDIIWMAANGEFRSGKLQGYGVVRYGKYGIYKGEFHNGMRQGQGYMTYNDPFRGILWLGEIEGEYEGLWKRDMRHGNGQMGWPSGLKYIGNFRSDKRDGVVGKMILLNGDTYEGEWVESLMQGNGVFQTQDRRIYKGKFFAGEFGGEGTLLMPNGEKYEGAVRNMLAHGLGKFYYKNGDQYHGEFETGIRSGKGTMCYVSGDKYEGEWHQNLRDGWGVMYYDLTKETYIGWWNQGVREGFGKLLDKDGRQLFNGNWKNDKKEGDGQLHLTSNPY